MKVDYYVELTCKPLFRTHYQSKTNPTMKDIEDITKDIQEAYSTGNFRVEVKAYHENEPLPCDILNMPPGILQYEDVDDYDRLYFIADHILDGKESLLDLHTNNTLSLYIWNGRAWIPYKAFMKE